MNSVVKNMGWKKIVNWSADALLFVGGIAWGLYGGQLS